MHVYIGNVGTDDEYGQGKWNALYKHIMSALVVQLYSSRQMDLSIYIYIYIYTKLLSQSGEGIVCLRSQQKFMKDIVEISRNHHNDVTNGGKANEVIPL